MSGDQGKLYTNCYLCKCTNIILKQLQGFVLQKEQNQNQSLFQENKIKRICLWLTAWLNIMLQTISFQE